MQKEPIILSAFLILPFFSACGQKTDAEPAAQESKAAAVKAENIKVVMDPVFHSTNALINGSDLEKLGFSFGDSVTLSFSNGLTLDDIPYHNGYYVRPNSPVAVAYPGLDGINLAFNLGEGSWNVWNLQNGYTVTITLKEKGRYLNEQETFAQSHSDDIKDYPDAETFANFRALSGGEIAPGVIYRSATMTNSTMNRADTVDDLTEQYGIRTILDFSDTEESLAGFRAKDTWHSDYFDRLCDTGSVHVIGLGVNPASEEFHRDLSQALYRMIQGEGPYLFFCTEGKDRTGYAAAVIEALCGAGYDELLADYMKTYENYYGMTEETAPEQCRAAIETSFDPIMEIIFEVQENEDLRTVPFE